MEMQSAFRQNTFDRFTLLAFKTEQNEKMKEKQNILIDLVSFVFM